MSKKDILERLSQTTAPRTVVRREAEATQEAKPAGAVKETRVSRRVVRRRRKGDTGGGDAAAEAASEGTPESSQGEVSRPETVVRRRPAEPTPEPVAAAPAAPAPEPVVAAPVAAPAPVAETPAAAAPVEAPAPVVAAAPAAPEPAKEQPKPAAAEPAPAKVAAAPAAPKERIKFEGLGSAVVVPPPGYDPTNPEAYRKTIDAQQKASRSNVGGTTAWRSGRRKEATASTPAATTSAPAADVRGGRGGVRKRAANNHFLRPNMRRKPRRGRAGPKKASPAPKGAKRKVRVDNVISVREIASQLSVKATDIIRFLMQGGQMVRVNDMLDMETAEVVAAEYDYEVENVGFQEDDILQGIIEGGDEEGSEPRPPVVTIMGHVDHGKTTLLDAIRKARVAQGEAGGITQHIGAYQVQHEKGTMTFLDTPGHAAFSAMRARGAEVTDIVVLVVAADDGAQPQTREAIQHAKAAGVPIIVAVNKMDKAGVNPDTVKHELAALDLTPEEWGGETQYAPISALRGDGIDELLEKIMLQAEVLELGAPRDRPAEGVVIEAKMERGRGAVASLLVQSGTLRAGDHVVLGAAFGKVRAMVDHRGKRIEEALPSTPVEIFGLSELPEVGDAVNVVKTEKDARRVAEHRALAKRQKEVSATKRRTAEDLFAAAQAEEVESLSLVIKADVQGSLEALRSAIQNLDVNGAEVRILLAGVGNITESDVNLVAANDAMILGFNVKLDANARRRADEIGEDPKLFDVIYGALDFVEARMKGLLAPEYREVRQGSAEVRALFHISKLGTIAGSYVLDGKVTRNSIARVLRDGEELYKGKLATLKRFKDDVKEVGTGYECGIALEGFNEIAEGDIIEMFVLEEIERT